MRKFLVGLAFLGAGLLSSESEAAGLYDCYSYRGWNQNFGITLQMDNGYYRCTDSNSKTFYMRFTGFGPGIGIGLEAFKMLQLGPGDATGSYGGVRLQFAALFGVNIMTMLGEGGYLQVIGVDFGVGFDPSLIGMEIVDDYSDFED